MIEHQAGGAGRRDILPDRRLLESDRVREHQEAGLRDERGYPFEQQGGEWVPERASENDPIDVEKVDYGDEPFGDIGSDFVDDGEGRGVSVVRTPGQGDERSLHSRGVERSFHGFESTVGDRTIDNVAWHDRLAESTSSRDGMSRTGTADHEISHLARVAARTAHDVVLQGESDTDAGTVVKECEVVARDSSRANNPSTNAWSVMSPFTKR